MAKQKVINFLVTVLCYCAICSKAQLNKGTWIGGTNFSYSKKNKEVLAFNETGKQLVREGNVQVYGGCFIQQNQMVGVVVMYHLESEKTTINQSTVRNVNYNLRTEVFSVGAFGRSYKMVKQNKFAFFGQLSLTYDVGTSVFTAEYPDLIPKVKPVPVMGEMKGVTAAIRPGLVYFLTGNLGLEITYGKLAFVHERIENSMEGKYLSKDVSSGVNTDFGLSSLTLGVSFYVPTKKY